MTPSARIGAYWIFRRSCVSHECRAVTGAVYNPSVLMVGAGSVVEEGLAAEGSFTTDQCRNIERRRLTACPLR